MNNLLSLKLIIYYSCLILKTKLNTLYFSIQYNIVPYYSLIIISDFWFSLFYLSLCLLFAVLSYDWNVGYHFDTRNLIDYSFGVESETVKDYEEK